MHNALCEYKGAKGNYDYYIYVFVFPAGYCRPDVQRSAFCGWRLDGGPMPGKTALAEMWLKLNSRNIALMASCPTFP